MITEQRGIKIFLALQHNVLIEKKAKTWDFLILITVGTIMLEKSNS